MSSLRHIIHAAAPCPADVKRAMIEWWGPVIYEFYGSTESSAVTFATSEDALKKPGTVGKISPGAELRFIGDDGQELPQGEIGEIYSRIAGNPDFTYHNKPEKRAEIDRDGFITSGDVGYIDADGYVFICDRKRDMVISGGVNIYPAEIEAALHALPGVHDCAVFGIPDAEFGEALMAVVEPQPGVTLDLASIRGQLKVVAGRLQGAEAHRDPVEPAAGRFRQDLQAPPARSLLGTGGAAGFRGAGRAPDAAQRVSGPLLILGAHAGHTLERWVPALRSSAKRAAPRPGRRESASPPSLSCTAAKKLHTRNCRAISEVASHVFPDSVFPDHAFRDRSPVQSQRRSAGIGGRCPAADRYPPARAHPRRYRARPGGRRRVRPCRTHPADLDPVPSRRRQAGAAGTRDHPRQHVDLPIPCGSSAPSAIFRISPTSPKTRTTSARCAAVVPAGRSRARSPRPWRTRETPASVPPSCAGSSGRRRSARC